MFSLADMTAHRYFLSRILAIALLVTISYAGVGDWKSYTDMKNIRGTAPGGNSIWAATTGGVFQFTPSDSAYRKLTNSEGLTTHSATAIFVDNSGRVWIGQSSGAIDVFNPSTGEWLYVTDILRSEKSSKSINGFFQSQDKLYIATGFGISLFSLSKFEFVDTYSSFAAVFQPNVLAVTVFQDQVFGLTDKGIVTSIAGKTNLAAPESWTVTSSSVSGNSLFVFASSVYAGTAAGLLRYSNGGWNGVPGALTPTIIVGEKSSRLFYCELLGGSSGVLKSIDSSGVIQSLYSLPDSVVSGSITDGGELFLGTLSNGIGRYSTGKNQWEFFFPNGPASNAFFSLAVDANSVVWGAAGRSSNKGFYSFDGTRWRNYSAATNSLISPDASYAYAIALGPENTKWISTWGGGLIVVNNDGTVSKIFDQNNPGFVGVSENTNYIVPGKAAMDRNGAMWITIFRSADPNKVIWKMNPDSSWQTFAGSPFGAFTEFMFGIEIDHNNTKWFTNAVTDFVRSATCVYLNEAKTIPGTTSTGWGTLTETDGLTNRQIQSIIVDRGGDVWMGTSSGVSIVTEPSNPSDRVSSLFQSYIRDQFITCLAVDAQNNKWVGTKSNGVFVFSPDGTQLLNQYTVANTNGKLVDDNIYSMAFDGKRGVMYFGTEKGLSSLEVVGISSSSSLANIDLSPNPVYLSQRSLVEIRGLVDESTIKVLSITGKVVAQFAAQGSGRAFWDCKDSNGVLVGSGVYIIVAHDRSGAQVASAKIAIIRK